MTDKVIHSERKATMNELLHEYYSNKVAIADILTLAAKDARSAKRAFERLTEENPPEKRHNLLQILFRKVQRSGEE